MFPNASALLGWCLLYAKGDEPLATDWYHAPALLNVLEPKK
jgi:hypothetical protein